MRRFLLLSVCSLLSASFLTAAYDFAQVSARSAGMGNAFLASSGESAALFVHPAGLATVESPEISFLYGKPYAGLPDVSLGAGLASFAVPTRRGSFGAGYSLFQAQGALKEETFALSYAASLRFADAGVTVKRLALSYSPGSDPLAAQDPVFSRGVSRSATAVDAGFTFPVARVVRAGVSVRNLNRPDVGFASRDRLPREVQAGLVFDLPGPGFRAAGDVLLRRKADGASRRLPSLGLEKALTRAFAARAGFNTDEYAVGFGLRQKYFGLDYAAVFSRNLREDSLGSHRVGVTCRFAEGRR